MAIGVPGRAQIHTSCTALSGPEVSEILVTCGMTSQVVKEAEAIELDKGISTMALREKSKKTLKSGNLATGET